MNECGSVFERIDACSFVVWVSGMNNITSPVSLPSPLGLHLISDFFGAKGLCEVGGIEACLCRAAEVSGAVVLQTNAHDFGARAGYTAVALLAESHISVHTWPEAGYVAIDIFMCGNADPNKALEILRAYYQPENCSTRLIERGIMAEAVGNAHGEN